MKYYGINDNECFKKASGDEIYDNIQHLDKINPRIGIIHGFENVQELFLTASISQ